MRYLYRAANGTYRNVFYGPSSSGLLENQLPPDLRDLWEAAHNLARAANDLVALDLQLSEEYQKEIRQYVATARECIGRPPDRETLAYIFSIPEAWASQFL